MSAVDGGVSLVRWVAKLCEFGSEVESSFPLPLPLPPPSLPSLSPLSLPASLSPLPLPPPSPPTHTLYSYLPHPHHTMRLGFSCTVHHLPSLPLTGSDPNSVTEEAVHTLYREANKFALVGWTSFPGTLTQVAWPCSMVKHWRSWE